MYYTLTLKPSPGEPSMLSTGTGVLSKYTSHAVRNIFININIRSKIICHYLYIKFFKCTDI